MGPGAGCTWVQKDKLGAPSHSTAPPARLVDKVMAGSGSAQPYKDGTPWLHVHKAPHVQ
jgi:hypothetical protein